MKPGNAELDERIAALLADPAYAGHPLREALQDLWRHTAEQMSRIERITHLSDAYQSMAHQREMGLCEQFDRQLRRLARIARISDHYQNMMRDLNATLEETSRRDPLTGLLNRRALVELAGAMRHSVREYDLCGRWGGEEFLVLLPATPPETAQGVMDRLVGAVRALAIDVGADVLRLTVSIGMAYHQLGETFSETLSRADQALYLAKQDGRDRVALGFPRR